MKQIQHTVSSFLICDRRHPNNQFCMQRMQLSHNGITPLIPLAKTEAHQTPLVDSTSQARGDLRKQQSSLTFLTQNSRSFRLICHIIFGICIAEEMRERLLEQSCRFLSLVTVMAFVLHHFEDTFLVTPCTHIFLMNRVVHKRKDRSDIIEIPTSTCG